MVVGKGHYRKPVPSWGDVVWNIGCKEVEGMKDNQIKQMVQCDGKVQHHDRITAKEALITMRRKFPKTTSSIYKCPHCHFWHIGRDGKK